MSGQESQKHSRPHKEHLHNPTGYTDEAATEEREFLEQAERSAMQGEGTNTKTAGGLGSSASNEGSGVAQKAGSTLENLKNKAKETVGK